MSFRSIEYGEVVPEEYGEACLEAALRLANDYLPSEQVRDFFDSESYLASLREMANRISKLLPVSIFHSKQLGETHDLLSRLVSIPYDIFASNCRVSAVVMGMVLERDSLAEEIALMNFAIDKNNLQHGRLIIRDSSNSYVAYFAAVDYSRVEPWPNTRFPYPEFPFTAQGIYHFENELGNI